MLAARAVLRVLEPAAGLVLNAVTGVVAAVLLVLAGVCAALVPVRGLGRRPLARVLGAVHALAAFHGAWAAYTLGRDPGEPPRWVAGGGPRRWVAGGGPGRAFVGGEGSGRALGWLAVHAVAGPACLIAVGTLLSAVRLIWRLRVVENTRPLTLALSLSVLAIVAVALAVGVLLHWSQARLAERLLRPAPGLDARVRELTESRAAVVHAQAAELRRIERDLHDGAQARLISVRMSLGLARTVTDPEQLRGLVREAWESAGQALTNLRDLVNGIHPPVLADRGLGGAIQAAALLCPIPVDLDIDLPERPEAPVESALYFSAAEALTNVTKHSGATRAWVRLRRSAGVLRLVVGDNGQGGATPAPGRNPSEGAGSGLDGIRRRLSAFDGELIVTSPPGGPTELTMEIPCASSSPKISPS
ncbi:hypothetical protein GCM10022419_075990 [Nonomuraea rosea]|uniref:histidine kinase n=1 Tax=Nonomuraea rosea TaxID=638574 RepID=A0ABP6YG16_9ACTN